MSTKKDRPNQQASPSLFQLVWSIVAPIIGGIILLVVEYKSGYFVQSAQSNSSSSLYHYWVISIAVMLSITILFAVYSLLVALHQHQNLREQFALLALFTATSATVVLIISMLSAFMPWSIPIAFLQAFKATPILRPDTRWAEYAFLMTIYGILLWLLNHEHKTWRGLKSVEDHRREQRSETINFVTQGFGELGRLARRDPPAQAYVNSHSKQFITQLESPTDSLAWKDQAKELIRLSSSSYAFDPDIDWHDKENCWVGRNVNTGDLGLIRK